MEKSKKIFKNLIIFILLIGLTFYMILKDQNILDIYNVVKSVKIQYVIIAIICMCLYLLLEGINLGRTLKVLKEKSSIMKNIKYALIGFFFSSITPAASGGQPMQIYYMYKDKISVANSTLALLINLCSFQIITLSAAFISVCLNMKHLNTGLWCFFIIGVSLNLSALALLLIGIFSKRLSEGLVRFAVKVLKFFKIKNIDKKQEKLESELSKYQGSANYIKENKFLMVKILFTTLVQVIIYYSIPYWIYCSFGFSEYNIAQIITLQSVLYATVSGIPSPGAVGVTEGGFMSLFKSVFPSNIISGAMLLNRGVSFYLFVLITGIFVTVISLKGKKEEENIKEEE
jgi:uncharacterized protein (TIRG00374 family)